VLKEKGSRKQRELEESLFLGKLQGYLTHKILLEDMLGLYEAFSWPFLLLAEHFIALWAI
jgi:hypothetical protein